MTPQVKEIITVLVCMAIALLVTGGILALLAFA